ncbi:MAG TPA: response regulator [Acidimicrobiia bacterium]|nr:response regulator [Acidimicrobiia bacterium]
MPRILVVDDQPDSLLAARDALVRAGHMCLLAADGERALELLARGGIDAVVLDPAMPLHDGWPVMAACTVPVVVVSNVPVPAAASTVPKPFRAADLVAAVGAALAR